MKNLIRILVLGALLRYCLYISSYQTVISERIEISTPVNSWKRVREALYLINQNLQPYSSDIINESPLNLIFYNMLVNICGSHLYILFIACDVLSGSLLYYAAWKYMVVSGGKYLNKKEDCMKVPQYAAGAYLFNPYVIMNCAALTTTVFSNLGLAVFVAGLFNNSIWISAAALAFSIHHSFYPIVLLSPLFLKTVIQHKSTVKGIVAALAVFVIWIMLSYFSYAIFNSWDFALHPYKYVLTVQNLRPNIGVFWYCFTEMFEHFRSLFMFALQTNVLLLYLVPMSIYFRKNPMLLTAVLLALLALYKPYPCIGDVGFVLAILLNWRSILICDHKLFIAGIGFYMAMMLAPIFWHLWIYTGSANANFYFGATLGFEGAQILLLLCLLNSYMTHELNLKHGNTVTNEKYVLYFE